MLNIIIGIFFILHGLIHLIGFVVPWRIINTDEMPYKTTLLAGRVDVGDVGIKLIGILWILGAVGFILAGYGLWTMAPWWFGVSLGPTRSSSNSPHFRDNGSQNVALVGQQASITLPQVLEQPGGAFDVGEQQGDRTFGQV